MSMLIYLYHCGKGEEHRRWIVRRFFFLQLCDSNINNMHKIKCNTDLDYSRIGRTDSFNHNS